MGKELETLNLKYRKEEQRQQEAVNKIQEAEERKAQRDAEKETKQAAEEVRKKAEEEAKKKAEEEGKKQRQPKAADKRKKTPARSHRAGWLAPEHPAQDVPAIVRVYHEDRVVRQKGSGLGVGVRESDKFDQERSGLKDVALKGKGKAKTNPKGKGKQRAVDEEEDMDIMEDKGDRDVEII
ncbi:hypothetical protein PAXINDRAFT_14448 [Paxillus involutus ATCC 200175]|uniref:Uncharacterized protein n=1 Tax=Paxillus involutus ATCC 200175 TaxID=664439 RepID=A0A0C9TQF7_PAXIN|nr:hypothetical protein PAXINDRAFT_14448 [Paxillus involutus ATCC 200175]